MEELFETLGICLGASTVSIVHLAVPAAGQADGQPATPRIIDHRVRSHGGDPRKNLIAALESIDMKKIDRIVATGRRFRHFVDLTTISEPEAVECAYPYVKPAGIQSPAIVSAGGETFMVYVLDDHGRISNVITGNKCASGTGEFFMQQLKRMGTSLEDAARFSASETPHEVSGRCSVFCKSDCTHAINKGIPKAKVTAGLCRMMANKILELLKNIDKEHVMIVGGSANNRMMIDYLQNTLSGLIVPDSAAFFEALGAALWAAEHQTRPFPGLDRLFMEGAVSFDTLEPLGKFEQQVTFKTMKKDRVAPGDRCILGLDVGSTTTKAVLIRESDNAMVASVYLFTHGDPVAASRACYQELLEQVRQVTEPENISIIGLGVCGSGRQIAGLHALTEGVINEIIAHASAAVHFDPDVDTLFEIGGQDAKYTYITSGVPSDYAMNEACSAGTGSFLAESAYETLGVDVEQIAGIAMKGDKPPNFNDQCAAFISSDIKTAVHEGVSHENIVAGLVYSICMNYINRVKGNRPVGEKVFMQGGVCYNHAVPLAMAALSGKPIVVPPEPGLMGAYGVGLEIRKRIDLGLMQSRNFDLQTLADREVIYKKPFQCRGGKEKCDRRCEIAVIELEGKKYPFGGACNRYINLRYNLDYDISALDQVSTRERMVFDRFAPDPEELSKKRGRIGFNRSFLINSYYPFFATFFQEIGYDPVLPDTASTVGIEKRNAAFCHPAELSHGYFYSLLNEPTPPDYIFLPHIRAIPGDSGFPPPQVCPFVQAEPYYLTTTFRKDVDRVKNDGTVFLTPYLDMSEGIAATRDNLVQTAGRMGISHTLAEQAFKKALDRQMACFEAMREQGRQALADLEKNPDKIAVVIFGRPYNAFVEDAHMGIPHKLASRGIPVIPLDFLPIEDLKAKKHMYWGMGQMIIKAARFVENHPQLFGTYITNFSCGPDSFLVGYFRDIMGRKPSLTLELDSHTADAGIETRIEAFLDIVVEYRQLLAQGNKQAPVPSFTPAKTYTDNGIPKVVTSSGETLPLTNSRVTFLVPSMGRLGTELVSAVFRDAGFHVAPHPPADEQVLKLGRANTSCKECLPLILTTGTLLNYINTQKKEDEILVYFMASASGPCRFGQYGIFMEDLVQRLQIPDVAIFSLTSDNSYLGLESNVDYYKAWWALLISDIMEDIRSMILANAEDPEQGLSIFHAEWSLIVEEMAKGTRRTILSQVEKTAGRLAGIPLKRPVQEVPTILITGEIYVRRDGLSRQYLTERLSEKGFAVMCSPVSEWIRYADYCIRNNNGWREMALGKKLKYRIRQFMMDRHEKQLVDALNRSGLIPGLPADVGTVIKNATPYISPHMEGEAILTVGSALTEIASEVSGVIAIGPFGCMPNRISESILSEIMTRSDKLKINSGHNNHLEEVLSDIDDLPFLSIECDGSPFPQLIEAKIEAFCLRAERLHQSMMSVRSRHPDQRR